MNLRTSFCWLLIVACTERASCGDGVAPHAVDGDSELQDGLRDYIVAGVRASRERLLRGIFKAARHEEARAGAPPAQQIELSYVFDFDQGMIRCDQKSLEPVKGTRDFDRRVILRPDALIVNKGGSGGSPTVMRYLPDHAELRLFQPPDVRAFGMIFASEFKLGARFEQKLAMFSGKNTKLVDCRKIEPALYKLKVGFGENFTSEETMTVSEALGFVPVDVELRYGKDAEERERAKPVYSVHTEWERRDGLWIPVAMTQTDGPANRPKWKVELDWKQVNEPIDPKVFTEEGLDLEVGTMVYEMRLDTGVLDHVVRDDEQPAVAPFVSEPARSAGFNYRTVILVVNVVAVIVLGCVVGWIRMRRARRKDP